MAGFDQGFKIRLASIRMFLTIWSLDRGCHAVLADELSQVGFS
jgi:hypothetical protein